jgi:predicted N-formylglutamate amidohydrolase
LAVQLGQSDGAPTRLLAPGEAPPFEVRNPGATSPLVLIGDHAGRAVPAALCDLGLPAAELERHIAWDIGVAALGARLADNLEACFIAQRFSRLVIDCNRDPERPDAIVETSDGAKVPGNIGLPPPERRRRIEEVFSPYHARIAQELDASAATGVSTLLVALHSFTPVMAGSARPWRYGVLHLGQSPACDALLARLRSRFGAGLVGDNEPYRMEGTDFTVPHHAVARGLDYVELEVRQDLIADGEGAAEVAAVLGEVLREVSGGC